MGTSLSIYIYSGTRPSSPHIRPLPSALHFHSKPRPYSLDDPSRPSPSCRLQQKFHVGAGAPQPPRVVSRRLGRWASTRWFLQLPTKSPRPPFPAEKNSPLSCRRCRPFVMPSGHRTSPSSGRRTESADPELIVDLTTQLNQALEERDKYKRQLEQTKRQSSISVNTSGNIRQPPSVQDLKAQVEDLKRRNEDSEDEVEQWKADYEALKRTHQSIYQEYEERLGRLRSENTDLKKKNEDLHIAYNSLSANYNSSMTSKLAERPKERGQKEYHAEAGRSSRDKDKKREKDSKRLSDRFEHDRGRGADRERDSRPPLTKTKRRDSYIEPFGPSSSGRATSRSRQVPRNFNPLGSPVYSSGSGGSAVEDGEDGNYHPYPVVHHTMR